MIVHKKFIFVHFPKTGGTFIQKFLLETVSECVSEKYKTHTSITEIKKRKNKFKFGFVRNPFDWYVSWWASNNEAAYPDFYQEDRNQNFGKWMNYILLEKTGKTEFWPNFDITKKYDIGLLSFAYLNLFCSDIDLPTVANLDKYIEANKSDLLLLDEVLRFEGFIDNLADLLKRRKDVFEITSNAIDTLPKEKRVKTSTHRKFHKYYTQELIDLVNYKERIFLNMYPEYKWE